MDEALGIILRLFTETEPIIYKSDWFELREAMLQLRPYQRPYMPIAVASIQSPIGRGAGRQVWRLRAYHHRGEGPVSGPVQPQGPLGHRRGVGR